MTDLPPPGGYPAPPPYAPQPGAPAPGWWQASDGNWYPPDQHPAYAAGYPPYGPPPAGTNGLAIASLVLGIGQAVAWILASVPAVILGHIALGQIRDRGQDGRGLAIAGLVLGYLGIAFFALFLLLLVPALEDFE